MKEAAEANPGDPRSPVHGRCTDCGATAERHTVWHGDLVCPTKPVEPHPAGAPNFSGEGGVREITARELVLRALRNVRPRRAWQKLPRWAAVSDSFGLGSTYSIELCRNFDLDPDEKIGGER
jgi:hypothetical protein